MAKSWRTHKYHAQKVEIDGIKFDSKAEARRYGGLKLREKAGEIDALCVHTKYAIPTDKSLPHICNVLLDFEYADKKDGKFHFEDVKGVDTAVSRLKRKLLKSFYGIDVEIIKARP